MTTHARQRYMNWKKTDVLRCATWNIRSLNGREQELVTELENHNIDMCALQETKKKGKGQVVYGGYIMIYTGVRKDERAKEGVAIALHQKYKDYIEECQYISSRILTVKIGTGTQELYIISVYAPEDNKPKQERELFYDQLQNITESLPQHKPMIILGDLNARIGNEAVPGVKQRFNEDISNDNGEMLVRMCALNELRINNTFFDHRPQYKYTFSNTRGQQSIIDYIITNRCLQPPQILDIRTLNSANVGSDHKLLLGKIRMKLNLNLNKNTRPNTSEEKINIESLWDASIKELYQKRLKEKIERDPIDEQDTINNGWEKLKRNIKEAATEALGTRKIYQGKRRTNKTPWFCKEVKEQCARKRKAYLKYMTTQTQEDYQEYKRMRNDTNTLVRQVKTKHWETFSKNMERDFYGLQKQIWRLIRNQRKEINELVSSNHISKETWVNYLKELYKKQREETEPNTPEIFVNDDIVIGTKDVESAQKKLKNRKSPGPDGIANELIKYGGQSLTEQLTTLINKILLLHRIPDEWRTSTTILLFKKGDKEIPDNYRGINLLSTTLKLTTKILTNKINEHTSLADEQQGFRSGRSCTDAIFAIRQITEKSIEYNRPAFMCFIDLEKAFDRIQLEDVIHLLQDRQIPYNVIKTIENIYQDNKVQAKIHGELTEEIDVKNGIRQGDSLSPLLFNITMDEIIKKVRSMKGYKMGNKEIKILCYADDAVLIAENEDDLQRLLHQFNITAKKFKMNISATKTKCMVTSKTPIRCKLELDNKVIQQEMKFKYLGIEISGYGEIETEVRGQAMKATRTAACLNNTIWQNKYIGIETKSRIYKTAIRPMLTYAAETRPETSKTKQILETTEMRVVRRMAGKTLRDRVRSEDIRRLCKIDNIGDWVLHRKREWNEHIDRMTGDRIVKITRDKSPAGRRNTGRPRKRWSDDLPRV